MKLLLACAALAASATALPAADDHLGWDLLLANDPDAEAEDADVDVEEDDVPNLDDAPWDDDLTDLLLAHEWTPADDAADVVGDMADLLATMPETADEDALVFEDDLLLADDGNDDDDDDDVSTADPLQESDGLTDEMRRASQAAARAAASAAAQSAETEDDAATTATASTSEPVHEDEEDEDSSRSAAVHVEARNKKSDGSVEADPALFGEYVKGTSSPFADKHLRNVLGYGNTRHMSYKELVKHYMTLLASNLQD